MVAQPGVRPSDILSNRATAVPERPGSGDDGTVAADSHPDRLNSDEVALVLRRAADLEAHTAGRATDDGFDAAAVEEAALEVGLSPAAVRQALAELQTGALAVDRGRRPSRRSDPSIVQAARLIPCPPEVVHSHADRYLHKQTFEARRRQDQVTLYRQRRDMAASLRRGLNFNGAIQLEGVRAVTLTITPVGAAATNGDDSGGPTGGRCMVRLVSELRGRAEMYSLVGFCGAAVAGTFGLLGLLFSAPSVVVGALVAGAGVTLGGLAIGRGWWRRRRTRVAETLDSLLDSLEQRPGLGP
jgi:hypothetical protein